MRQRHRGRHPEREQESEIQRVAHIPVRRRHAEAYGRIRLADERQPHLSKAEQIEVVDQERDDEHCQPARGELAPEQGADEWILDRPDRDADGPPLPEQQEQREARKQHERRALDCPRHNLRPPLLEPSARHDAVLHGKDRQQQRIDCQRRQQRARRVTVEAGRRGEATDERDGVEERGEEHDVGNDAVGKER